MPTPTPKQIGMTLKRIRKQKGLSQYALAKTAGVSREHLRTLEAGKSDPTVGMLQRLEVQQEGRSKNSCARTCSWRSRQSRRSRPRALGQRRGSAISPSGEAEASVMGSSRWRRSSTSVLLEATTLRAGLPFQSALGHRPEIFLLGEAASSGSRMVIATKKNSRRPFSCCVAARLAHDLLDH